MADLDKQEALKELTQRSDILMAITVVGIIIVMILPLPFIVLDILLALNIAVALVVLLVVTYTVKALEFNSFPSLLLMLTLFRLSLNVASTRLILLNGNNFDGKIIKAFGTFVVGGNYVVGMVIFLILVVIQFVVITKGAQRIAEVAARFTLDAMPGKQMAIDADLNAGLIDEREAIKRRQAISEEADFYGAMDGASKFVRGDAVAGLIITAINILGGFIIGIVQLHMDFKEALQVYTLLTIGDGLVAQIPALLISTAAGIIVTRAASEYDMGKDLTSQLIAQPRAIAITAVFLIFFGMVPGLPKLPFFILAGLVGSLAYAVNRAFGQAKERMERIEEQEQMRRQAPESVENLLQIDPIELEIGYGLIPLVDHTQGGNLLDRITTIRRQCALDLGLIVPPIRIRDNMQIEANTYVIKLRGVEVARGSIMPGYYLAMNPGTAEELIPGIKTTEPAFGLPALWISENQKAKAESAGYTVVEDKAVISTHLSELIKKHAHEILGRQEVKNLLDNLKKSCPAVVEEVVPNLLTLGGVQKVLQNLLRERVPIRDLVTILEVLGDYAPRTKDTDILTEYVRHSLARTICKQYYTDGGKIQAITLDTNLENMLNNAIKKAGDTSYIALKPQMVQNILDRTAEEVRKNTRGGISPVIICSPQVRMYFKRLTEKTMPNLAVLSFNEIVPEVSIEPVGMVEV